MTLTAPRDWTKAGVGELSLWLRGLADNATEPMYVSISNSTGAPAVVTHEDLNAAQELLWNKWLIPLQAFSDHYQLQTGKYLFPDNLSSANDAMRKIIGEPYGSELDRIVIATMKKTGVIEAVKAFASEEKKIHFSNKSTIWNHGPAGSMDTKDLSGLGLSDDL